MSTDQLDMGTTVTKTNEITLIDDQNSNKIVETDPNLFIQTLAGYYAADHDDFLPNGGIV